LGVLLAEAVLKDHLPSAERLFVLQIRQAVHHAQGEGTSEKRRRRRRKTRG